MLRRRFTLHMRDRSNMGDAATRDQSNMSDGSAGAERAPAPRYDPGSGRGWRRMCFIAALLWIPVTLLLQSLGIFSSGFFGFIWAPVNLTLFAVSGLVVIAVMAFAGPWIVRGFQQRED